MPTNTSHKIGLATATIIGMNAMIGSGIFTAPAAVATHIGPAAILTYIFVGIAVWFMANSLARLAKLFPEEGSFYTYAKQWGGHTVGMIAISSYCIGLTFAMGLLTRVAANYLVTVFPAFSITTLGFMVLLSLIVLNIFGVGISKIGQHILIVLTVFPLTIITLMCFLKANLSHLTPFAPYGLANILKSSSAVIFGFFGFECAASLFNIVKDPEKNVPRALTYAILFVGTLYTLFVTAIILAVPLNTLIDPFTPLTEALQKVFPTHTWLINVLLLSILSAIIGTIHSMLWSVSHLLLLIVDKIKNPTLHNLRTSGILNQRTAVLIVGLLMGVSFISLQNISLFFNITAIGIVLAYILSMITLLTMPSEWKSRHNIKTIIGFATALLIFYFAGEGLITEIIKLS